MFFLKGRWYNLTEFQLHHLGSVFHHHVPITSGILVLSTIFGLTSSTLSTLNPSRKAGSWVAKRMHIRATWILRGSLTRPRNAQRMCPYGLSMPMVRQWFVNEYLLIYYRIRMSQNVSEYVSIHQNAAKFTGTMCYMRETMWNMPRKGKKKSLDSRPISRKSPLSPELPCFHSLDEIAPWQHGGQGTLLQRQNSPRTSKTIFTKGTTSAKIATITSSWSPCSELCNHNCLLRGNVYTCESEDCSHSLEIGWLDGFGAYEWQNESMVVWTVQRIVSVCICSAHVS